jgi:hypothetical protein
MPTKLTVQCLAWRPLAKPKGTLLGFCSIRVAELRLALHDVAVHRKNDALWAQLPARPWVEAGVLVKNEAGKIQYSPIAEFDGREVRDAFSRAVVEAVLRFDPNALALEAAT